MDFKNVHTDRKKPGSLPEYSSEVQDLSLGVAQEILSKERASVNMVMFPSENGAHSSSKTRSQYLNQFLPKVATKFSFELNRNENEIPHLKRNRSISAESFSASILQESSFSDPYLQNFIETGSPNTMLTHQEPPVSLLEMTRGHFSRLPLSLYRNPGSRITGNSNPLSYLYRHSGNPLKLILPAGLVETASYADLETQNLPLTSYSFENIQSAVQFNYKLSNPRKELMTDSDRKTLPLPEQKNLQETPVSSLTSIGMCHAESIHGQSPENQQPANTLPKESVKCSSDSNALGGNRLERGLFRHQNSNKSSRLRSTKTNTIQLANDKNKCLPSPLKKKHRNGLHNLNAGPHDVKTTSSPMKAQRKIPRTFSKKASDDQPSTNTKNVEHSTTHSPRVDKELQKKVHFQTIKESPNKIPSAGENSNSYSFDEPLILNFQDGNLKREIMLYTTRSMRAATDGESSVQLSKTLEKLLHRSKTHKGDPIHVVFNPRKVIQVLRAEEKLGSRLVPIHPSKGSENLLGPKTKSRMKGVLTENKKNIEIFVSSRGEKRNLSTSRHFRCKLRNDFCGNLESNSAFSFNATYKNEVKTSSVLSEVEDEKKVIKVRICRSKKSRTAFKRMNVKQIVSSVFRNFFHYYSVHGGHLQSGAVITKSNSNIWLKNAGLVTDTNSLKSISQLFTDVAGTKVVLNIYDYLQFLKELAKEKNMVVADLLTQLMTCRLPTPNRMKKPKLIVCDEGRMPSALTSKSEVYGISGRLLRKTRSLPELRTVY